MASTPPAVTPDSDLARRVLTGDYRAIARLITLVENLSPRAVPCLRELYPHTGRAFSIGVTGSPGSGKSTLVDRIAGRYRDLDMRVAIIAVDPTSPFSGGAILGDRIRMQSRSLDPGTFIRSMATRGQLGGLARATKDVLLVMDAAGFDVVVVETVGVGQDEVEVARTADATLVLLVPGMGDDIQAMKAGIMEIGDVFVVNKADRPGVDRVEAELGALLSISARPDGWRPRVVRTVATENRGIEECVAAVDAYRAFLTSSDVRRRRSLQIQKERLLDLAQSQVMRSLLSSPEAMAELETLAEEVATRRLDPYTATDIVLQRLGFTRQGLRP